MCRKDVLPEAEDNKAVTKRKNFVEILQTGVKGENWPKPAGFSAVIHNPSTGRTATGLDRLQKSMTIPFLMAFLWASLRPGGS